SSRKQIIGARRLEKKRSVAQPDRKAPAMPPKGSTAYLKAARLTLSPATSFNCVTPQSVNPYRQASSKQSETATSQREGLARVSRRLSRKLPVMGFMAIAPELTERRLESGALLCGDSLRNRSM